MSLHFYKLQVYYQKMFITTNSNLDTKNLFSYQKKALGTFFLKHLTNGVPNVKFGTKWLQKTM